MTSRTKVPPHTEIAHKNCSSSPSRDAQLLEDLAILILLPIYLTNVGEVQSIFQDLCWAFWIWGRLRQSCLQDDTTAAGEADR